MQPAPCAFRLPAAAVEACLGHARWTDAMDFALAFHIPAVAV